MSTLDCDVLVVGLGPVGDVLAGLVRQHGLSVIAIDAAKDIYPLPRAAVFDQEIMRVFQALGVARRIVPLCRVPGHYEFVTASGEVLLDFPISAATDNGWAGTYTLHQPAIEQVLRDRLTELGVDVRLGTTFIRLSQTSDGVDADVECDRVRYRIRARYLVACDGANSTVREHCRIQLQDLDFDEPWLVLDTIAQEPHHLPVVCQQICDPMRPVTHLAMSGNRFRWEFMLKPGESAETMLSDQRIAELLEPWGHADRIVLERKAVYRFHALVAQRWREENVFLVGDAAHQMPPFAGQGMCSGIRDAVNLAWKLAIVMTDHADERLLDTYQIERAPHVRAIISTAIAMGRVVCLLDPALAAERDAVMLARRRSGAQDVSVQYPNLVGGLLTESPGSGSLFPQPIVKGQWFDELLGDKPTLIADGLGKWHETTVEGIDLSGLLANRFAAPIQAWLAAHHAPAVLIRPDRVVFGTGMPGELLAAWRTSMHSSSS